MCPRGCVLSNRIDRPNQPQSLLLVSGDPHTRSLAGTAIRRRGSQFELSFADFLGTQDRPPSPSPDLVIADLPLLAEWPNWVGQAHCPPVVVMADLQDMSLAADAIRRGAWDYFLKTDASLSDLAHIADRAIRSFRDAAARKPTQDPVPDSHSSDDRVVILAHELAQPLGAISNFAVACQHRAAVGDLTSPEIGELLLRISQQAHRAGEILRRHKESVDAWASQRSPADINQLVEEVVALLRAEFETARVGVELLLAPKLPKLPMDSVQIQQVLVNLLLNALQAIRNESDRNRRISITTELKSERVQVEVRDHGAGVPPELRSKIFDRFVTTKPESYGLGLGISLQILKAHQGQIGFRPNDNRGATFFFTLPIIDGPRAED